ncbi:hypothetical protein EUX98_g3655 [Antrodiella citrinella]|uniref:tRNA-splicing endonuclease subunit Sen54 N-terminal domain-containing protein n=1 Tax=Antrodiella citrinella TaxID=2447956 RepID=A0A4S4MYG1_9APHY|nr:hypothetical protein EUX98_g3655 [Antrodiella citrinella]
MGHSVPRPVAPQDGQQQKVAKRLELLPEEAIYLVERGSMFCWKALEDISPRMNGLEEMEGAPMSVQQVFAEMIGTEDLTLEKYQVFAYLKRLGYVVMRTKAPSPAYLTAAPHVPLSVRTSGWFSRLLAAFTGTFSKVLRVFRRTPEFWRPGLFHHGLTYSSMFKSLRVIPSGHSTPLQVSAPDTQQPSIYDIFYNVYKPATPFKKTAPSKPDFQIVVVNARTTPMPTLSELTDLFDILPELPTPVPRRRIPYAEQKNTAAPHVPTQPTATDPTTTPSNPSPSLVHRLFWWALPTPPPVTSAVPIRRPNPFAILKQGKKMVVVAAVDAGAISFFSFRQGGFEEFPMA